MLITKTSGELAGALGGVPSADIFFVPTMGALHEGHLSLVKAAVKAAQGGDTPQKGKRGVVVVSIFVNPTQFNDPDDLKNYPRTPERDLEMLREAGADVVFMPSVEEIYPGPQGCVRTCLYDFGELGRIMEGATRPGHFDGVAQVVSRLFELVKPGTALFGQKDFQQVAIIREMVRQAKLAGERWADVEIVECPIIREADGLAMSSRNVLLTPHHRAAAADIHRALLLGAGKAREMTPGELERFVVGETERSGLLKVIYFTVWGPRACIAVQAGGVRLIDNMEYDNRSS